MGYRDYDTRLGSYAVIIEQRQRQRQPHVLLALWNEVDPPRWSMPGGGVELDETVEQACIREVFEESGFHVELNQLLGVHSFVVPPRQRVNPTDRPLKPVRVIFEATIVGGELTREQDGTTDEARWVPLADVAGLDRLSLVDVSLDLWRRRQQHCDTTTAAGHHGQVPGRHSSLQHGGVTH
ncbi:MAG: DNA mismatch repair protein MutT [Actinomycetales bacterium]|nr:MAG: DNA mismatch repair protein MutT [Actinomycetales bacterium]